MRWEQVSFDKGNEVYQLCKDDTVLLTLHYHSFSQSARVESAGERRVFQIRKEGFLRNKTVLRTEYGIKIGELGHEGNRNFITINNERYYYNITNSPFAELQLFRAEQEQPLVTCGIKTDNGHPEVRFKRDKEQLSGITHSGLLMALCWYMFLPVTKENIIAEPAGL